MSKDSNDGWRKIIDGMSGLREGASMLMRGALQKVLGNSEVPAIPETAYHSAVANLVKWGVDTHSAPTWPSVARRLTPEMNRAISKFKRPVVVLVPPLSRAEMVQLVVANFTDMEARLGIYLYVDAESLEEDALYSSGTRESHVGWEVMIVEASVEDAKMTELDSEEACKELIDRLRGIGISIISSAREYLALVIACAGNNIRLDQAQTRTALNMEHALANKHILVGFGAVYHSRLILGWDPSRVFTAHESLKFEETHPITLIRLAVKVPPEKDVELRTIEVATPFSVQYSEAFASLEKTGIDTSSAPSWQQVEACITGPVLEATKLLRSPRLLLIAPLSARTLVEKLKHELPVDLHECVDVDCQFCFGKDPADNNWRCIIVEGYRDHTNDGAYNSEESYELNLAAQRARFQKNGLRVMEGAGEALHLCLLMAKHPQWRTPFGGVAGISNPLIALHTSGLRDPVHPKVVALELSNDPQLHGKIALVDAAQRLAHRAAIDVFPSQLVSKNTPVSNEGGVPYRDSVAAIITPPTTKELVLAKLRDDYNQCATLFIRLGLSDSGMPSWEDIQTKVDDNYQAIENIANPCFVLTPPVSLQALLDAVSSSDLQLFVDRYERQRGLVHADPDFYTENKQWTVQVIDSTANVAPLVPREDRLAFHVHVQKMLAELASKQLTALTDARTYLILHLLMVLKHRPIDNQVASTLLNANEISADTEGRLQSAGNNINHNGGVSLFSRKRGHGTYPYNFFVRGTVDCTPRQE